ncbi:MAG: hypothetical protein JWM73_2559 [Solirubrobacterales bacterium]|nr:hypothetical protein [Solirubrobacterales bacterium]
MAQAARSLPPDRDAASPPSLRVVPPPRGPSPQVVRRRRAVALAALVVLVALPVVWLGSGGAGTDSERIAALLTRGASRPPTLCDHLSSPMLEAVGGHDACVKASPERAPAGRVQDVRVAGDTASAVVVRDGDQELVRLVRQDGVWKVDDVR